jgi:hypothetical protein
MLDSAKQLHILSRLIHPIGLAYLARADLPCLVRIGKKPDTVATVPQPLRQFGWERSVFVLQGSTAANRSLKVKVHVFHCS